MLSPPQLHLAEKKNYEVVDSVIEVLQRKPSHKPWQSVNINFVQSKQELSAYTAFGKPPKKIHPGSYSKPPIFSGKYSG